MYSLRTGVMSFPGPKGGHVLGDACQQSAGVLILVSLPSCELCVDRSPDQSVCVEGRGSLDTWAPGASGRDLEEQALALSPRFLGFWRCTCRLCCLGDSSPARLARQPPRAGQHPASCHGWPDSTHQFPTGRPRLCPCRLNSQGRQPLLGVSTSGA